MGCTATEYHLGWSVEDLITGLLWSLTPTYQKPVLHNCVGSSNHYRAGPLIWTFNVFGGFYESVILGSPHPSKSHSLSDLRITDVKVHSYNTLGPAICVSPCLQTPCLWWYSFLLVSVHFHLLSGVTLTSESNHSEIGRVEEAWLWTWTWIWYPDGTFICWVTCHNIFTLSGL